MLYRFMVDGEVDPVIINSILIKTNDLLAEVFYPAAVPQTISFSVVSSCDAEDVDIFFCSNLSHNDMFKNLVDPVRYGPGIFSGDHCLFVSLDSLIEQQLIDQYFLYYYASGSKKPVIPEIYQISSNTLDYVTDHVAFNLAMYILFISEDSYL